MKYATSRKEKGLPSPLPSPSPAGWNVDRTVGAGTDFQIMTWKLYVVDGKHMATSKMIEGY